MLSLILPILGTVPLFPMVRLNNLRFAYRHSGSGIGQVRIMDSQSLWYYRDQLQRIVEESLEVSLVICKADLVDFSIGKASFKYVNYFRRLESCVMQNRYKN